MEYLIAIFLLGLIVTLVVGKGILLSREFAKSELERQAAEAAVRAESQIVR